MIDYCTDLMVMCRSCRSLPVALLVVRGVRRGHRNPKRGRLHQLLVGPVPVLVQKTVQRFLIDSEMARNWWFDEFINFIYVRMVLPIYIHTLGSDIHAIEFQRLWDHMSNFVTIELLGIFWCGCNLVRFKTKTKKKDQAFIVSSTYFSCTWKQLCCYQNLSCS